MKLTTCPNCGKTVTEETPVCPHCGHSLKEIEPSPDKTIGSPFLVIGTVIFVIIAIIVVILIFGQ